MREKIENNWLGEEGLPLEYCDIETPDYLNPISIEKEMMRDDQIYTRKIEIGKIITNMLENGSVREDSLSKDNREVLKLYRKKYQRVTYAKNEQKLKLTTVIVEGSDYKPLYYWTDKRTNRI